ncbi:SMODS domain-containing nucleotidyltransferase [Sorangium sp. So ce341]|uniref:SMODS domain-containing nucleotidyltransferase n=1 Tax=Sorangium sp. So ce341 TaxID=3133302 RepID=UPI003F63DAE0
MKFIEHFNNFLSDTVNLNQTRIDRLESSVVAIKNVIRDSDWDPKVRGFASQGSWAHKTIIKPTEGGTFDADLLVYVDPVVGWDAAAYVNSLCEVFEDHGTYKDKVKAWEYCITITYAGDFKIDVVPCVRDRVWAGHEVCNRKENRFEVSKPAEYTAWLIERNTWTGSNAFRKVTRLLKYLRDIKGTFTCASVLLTTLLGYRIAVPDQYNTEPFDDVPTALRTIVDRLDDWLQLHQSKPAVLNPVLPTEDFARLWDDAKYSNFREKIHLYRGWIDDAYKEPDRDESIGKWRRVFGDDFAAGVELEAASISKTAVVALARANVSVASEGFDMVNLLSVYGSKAIPEGINRLPYMHRPKWQVVTSGQFPVSVTMSLYSTRNGSLIRRVDDLSALPKGCWVKFDVFGPGGVPLSKDYVVHWRITNTDREAIQAKRLRGGFNVANDGTSHWEALSYRGLHLAEAFVLRKRDQRLVAQSAPRFVVIE